MIAPCIVALPRALRIDEREGRRALNRTASGAATIGALLVGTLAWAQPLPPGTPGQPDVTVVGSAVTITWASPSSGGIPTHYLIAAGTTSETTNLGVHHVGAATSIGPVTLADGVYFIRVFAANAVGTGPASIERSFVVGSVAAPGAPGTPTASVMGGTVILRWSAPTSGGPPTHYLIIAGTTFGGANLGTYNVGLTTTISATVAAGTYFVRIVAVNAVGPSPPSGDASFTIEGLPGPPGTPTVQANGATITITWAAPTSGGAPAYYLLAAGSTSGAINYGIHNAGASTSFTATVPLGTYFIRIIAVNAFGQGPASGESAFTVGDLPALLVPQPDAEVLQNDPTIGCPLHASRGYGFRITFDWTDVVKTPTVAGYHLYLIAPSALNPFIDTIVSTSTFVVTSCNGFVADVNLRGWQWRVRTIDAQGVYGSWTSPRLLNFAPCRLASGAACST